MPRTIKRSVIRRAGIEDFPLAVDTFVREHAAWEAHTAEVHAGRAEAYPAPSAHPLVAAAIRGESDSASGLTVLHPDFVIHEDEVELAFQAKRQALFTAISERERAAIEAILPPGKRRLYGMRWSEATAAKANAEQRAALIEHHTTAKQEAETWLAADPERAKSEAASISLGRLDRATKFLTDNPPLSISAEDARFLVEHGARIEAARKVERWAAEQHAAIEDLTAETVMAWSPQPLPT